MINVPATMEWQSWNPGGLSHVAAAAAVSEVFFLKTASFSGAVRLWTSVEQQVFQLLNGVLSWEGAVETN